MFTIKNSITSLMFLCAVMGFNSVFAGNEIKAKKAEPVPVIDGKLNDPCWKNAAPVKDFKIMNTNNPSRLDTTAYILYDNTALYIGVICQEKDISSIKKTENAARDADAARSDCVEIMIDPENGKNDYFHIIVSAAGAIFDRECTQGGFIGDAKWDGEITAASYIGDKYWSCEIMVPFYTLGISPKVKSTWGINICREKKNPEEISSIAAGGTVNVAGNFPELTGLDVDFSQYFFNVGAPVISTASNSKGTLDATIKANVSNKTGKDAQIIFECDLISPSKKASVRKKTETLKNAESRELFIDKIELPEQGDYTCMLRLADPVTKKNRYYKKLNIPIEYTPISLKLIEPWYHNAIFETQNLKNVIFTVEPKISAEKLAGAILTAGICKAGDKTPIVSKDITKISGESKFEFPVEKLPYAKLEAFASIKNAKGEILAEISVPFKKLALRKGEVWLGKDLIWHVDGKPFFMLGAWNYPENFYPEYNVFTSEKPGAKLINTKLMSMIFHDFKRLAASDRMTDEQKKKLIEYVQKTKDDANLFAYYITDEPECGGTNAKALTEAYNIVIDEDPYHPLIMSNDSMSGLKDYAFAADINGLHPYPTTLKNKEHNDISKVVAFTEGTVKYFENLPHKQTVAYLHQGFNYGDYGSVNNRIPNYKEYRNQNILSLICGGKGILQYNRMVEHYPELYIGMPELTKELKYLGDIILAPDSKLSVKTSSNPIRSMIKEFNGNQYVFVCNAQMKPEDIEISIPGIGKPSLNVISEGRSVNLSKDAFKDHFRPYEVHIYTTSNEKPRLLTVKEICDKIDKANAARKKPGNLAFQMFEGDGVKVTASSNKAGKRTPTCGLWHVSDGITNTKTDHYNVLAWHDDSPGVFPDWIEVQLPEAKNINRVVVYPFNKSLKDYSVQAFINGEWKDVDKVTGKKDDMTEHKFSTVKTDKVRLWITAANGKNSEVSEIEIYGPEKK